MKRIALLCLALAAVPAWAESFEVETARRNCKVEQNSMMRHRNGTPSCDLLYRLLWLEQQERIERSHQAQRKALRELNEQSEKARREAAMLVRPQRNGDGQGYRWNPNQGAYCYHDAGGYPYQCD